MIPVLGLNINIQSILITKYSKIHKIFLFAGNHYGTPKPSKESKPSGNNSATSRVSDENSSSTPSAGGAINFPGAHPSSEGKRRRNRSNVEAMTAKNLQDDVDKEDLSATTGNSCYKHFISPSKFMYRSIVSVL